MSLAAGKCGNALHEVKDTFQLAMFFAKTVSMMFKGQIAIAIELHQFRGGRAEPQDKMRPHAEAGGDFFRTKTALLRQLLEGL